MQANEGDDMATRMTAHGVALDGHADACLCVKCMMADMDNYIRTTRGEGAVVRINAGVQQDKATVTPVKTRNLNAGQRVGNGYVRTISEAQVRLIMRLIKERDLTNLTLIPGQTINPAEIRTMGVKGGTALIDKLFSCPVKASVSDKKEIKGTEKQIDWITKGLNGKPSLLAERGILEESDIKALYIRCDYLARNIISELIAMPKAVSKKEETQKASEILSEGMYKRNEKIFKVYYNQAGTRLLAKELIDGSFEYQGIASRFVKPEDRMTLDEAKAYGRVTGTCCVCSRRLTDEMSIAEGIGPICASKF